jgi:hypothetical protein
MVQKTIVARRDRALLRFVLGFRRPFTLKVIIRIRIRIGRRSRLQRLVNE